MNRHQPIKHTRPVKAIREFCLECVGTRELVRDCQVTACALHDFRMGKNPHHKPTYTPEAKERQRERAKNLNKQS